MTGQWERLSDMGSRLSKFLEPYTRSEAALLYLALVYLVTFQIIIQYELNYFINERVIFEVGSLLVAVEGVLVALSPQIRIKSIRDWVAVGVGVPALMLTIISVTVASYQSIQLGYLSQDFSSYLFRASTFLFVLLVELYSIGVLFSKQKDDQQPTPNKIP
jgi:hypothetical protein